MVYISDPDAPGGANNPISLSAARALYGTDQGVNISGATVSFTPVFTGVGGAGGKKKEEAQPQQQKQDTKPKNTPYFSNYILSFAQGKAGRFVGEPPSTTGGGYINPATGQRIGQETSFGIPVGVQGVSPSGNLRSASSSVVEPNVSLATGGVGVGVGGRIVSRTESQPINLKAGQATANASKYELATIAGTTVIRNKLTGRTVEVPSVKSEKGDILRARLLVLSERTGDLSSGTVSQNAAAIGLGRFASSRSAVVEQASQELLSEGGRTKDEQVSFFENRSASVVPLRTGKEGVSVGGVFIDKENQFSVNPKSIVANPLSGNREQLSRAIFKAGETNLESSFAKTASQTREGTKALPFGDVVGDVGAGFVNFVGGLAKAEETILRAPFVASRALYETATQGRPSKETVIQSAGNVGSLASVLPTSLVFDIEKTVASPTGEYVVRPPEEIKQGLITAIVGLGVAGTGAGSARTLGGKAISGTEAGQVFLLDTRTAGDTGFGKGYFETTGTAKTGFGQTVKVPAGGDIVFSATKDSTTTAFKGIAKPKGEVVPIAGAGVVREVSPGVSLGIDKAVSFAGKQTYKATSVSAGRVLAVVPERAFQGQLGGKIPVGGTLDITKTATVGKTAGKTQGGTSFKIFSETLITEPKAPLPKTLGAKTPSTLVFDEGAGQVVKFQQLANQKAPFTITNLGVGKVAAGRAAALQEATKVSEVRLARASALSGVGYSFYDYSTGGRVYPTTTYSQTKYDQPVQPFKEQFYPPVKPQKTITEPGAVIFDKDKGIFVPKGGNVGFAVPPKVETQTGRLQPTTVSAQRGQQQQTGLIPAVLTKPAFTQGQGRGKRGRTDQLFDFGRDTQTKQRQITTPTVDYQQLQKQITGGIQGWGYSTPNNRIFDGGGGLFGAPKPGGFEGFFGRGFGLRGKSPRVKGLIPDLFSIGLTQKATGKLSYTLPKTKQIQTSRTYRRSGGLLAPTLEQIKKKAKVPKKLKLGRFF